jgi:magnesium-transporting ATPase (P-type)
MTESAKPASTAKHAHPKMKMWIIALVLVVLSLVLTLVASQVYWKDYLKDKTGPNAAQQKNTTLVMCIIAALLLFATYFVVMHHVSSKHKTVYWVGAVVWALLIAFIVLAFLASSNHGSTVAKFANTGHIVT